MLPLLDVLPKGRIDQRLVAPTPGLADLRLEPLQNILIQPDRDSCLTLRRSQDGATLRLAEVILLWHHRSAYCRRSAAVARRAEMSRMSSPRGDQATTSNWPPGPSPRVTNRSSPYASGSDRVSPSGSSRTSAASAKSTRCFSRLPPAFFGSHPYATVRSMHKCAYTCQVARARPS